MPKYFEFPSAQVPCAPQVPQESKCLLSAQVSKLLECPVAQALLEYLSTLSTQVPFECLKCSSALGVSGVRVLECLECLESQSVSLSQLVSLLVSQLIYNTYSVSYIYFKC